MATEKKTPYAILGLLSHEPMSGYEIKKRMDTVLKFFWGASYGGIYPALSALAGDGFIAKRETGENARGKATYAITDAGRAKLAEWLRVPAGKDELRYETLLKLFFGNEAGSLRSIGHIQDFERKIRAELSVLRGMVGELERVKDADSAHVYYLLTAMFGVKTFEAYLEWCREATATLMNGEQRRNGS